MQDEEKSFLPFILTFLMEKKSDWAFESNAQNEINLFLCSHDVNEKCCCKEFGDGSNQT